MVMKFSNFIFPAAETPEDDGRVIRESVAEAQLCDRLGVDTVWLAEHHFDGICAYVDPVSFAAALATCTENIKIGFAVAQMSLHHPIRFAEQMNMIDHLSKGRLIVGLGRGTAYNIYDYQGYDIDADEAQERLLESEEIMLKAWTTENFEYKGKYWNIKLPKLRPVPYTKPHPTILRASSSEGSMVGLAKEGRPFMMNVQSDEVTKHRMDLYRQTLAEDRIRRRQDCAERLRQLGLAKTSSLPKPMKKPNASGCRHSPASTSSGPKCGNGSMKNKACACRKKRKALPGTIRRTVLSTDRPRRWPNASPRSTQLASAAS